MAILASPHGIGVYGDVIHAGGADPAKNNLPLLSCSDIESLLCTFLPRRDVKQDEVLRQMVKHHRKRQAAIDSQYRKQVREQLVRG